MLSPEALSGVNRRSAFVMLDEHSCFVSTFSQHMLTREPAALQAEDFSRMDESLVLR